MGASPVATDALFVLRAAVSIEFCNPCFCDIDSSGATTATDALGVLKAATGQPVTLNCSPCGCFDAIAPTCGGTCQGAGEICAPDPFEPEFCECLDACRASSAPVCGGSCEGEEEPGLQCTVLSFEQEEEMIDVCECLPPGLTACGDADAPECFGVCSPGTLCTDSGGSCSCEAQPLQGTCAQAAAPACGGTCDGMNLCQPNISGTCSCAPSGAAETCFDAESPICGGACTNGELCAVGFLGDCDCHEACELAAAPACGGACDSGEQCVLRSVRFDTTTVQFCECDEIAP